MGRLKEPVSFDGYAISDFMNQEQVNAMEELESGKILVADVGSGKSRVAIGYFFFKIVEGGYDDDLGFIPPSEEVDLYIITTAKKRDSFEWESELSNFLLSTDRKVGIQNFNIKVDSWNNLHKYKEVKDAFFIFDEQRLVGKGEWVKSFINISKNNRWILLTATPGDTWSDYIPVFIANGFYKNRTDFLTQHAVYSNHIRYKVIDRYIGTSKLLRLREQISVYMFVNREVQKHHYYISCGYPTDIYRATMKNRWDYDKQEPIKDASELCYKLRKMTNVFIDRIYKLRELLRDHQKVIIFYNFDDELDILRFTCEDMYIPFAEWNGHRHEDIPKEDSWAYLVQYAAGAEGWNCIETDTIIFYSQTYSYKTMMQAAGRIDRMNTPFKNLYYYHLTSNAPIDRAIDMAIKRKKNFNESQFVRGAFRDEKRKLLAK